MDVFGFKTDTNYVNGHSWQQAAYENLANAIIQAACDDYVQIKAYGGVINKGGGAVNMKSLLKFFHSEWYSCLTKVDPDYLIDKLDEKAANLQVEMNNRQIEIIKAKARKQLRNMGYSDRDAKTIVDEFLIDGFKKYDDRGRIIKEINKNEKMCYLW